MNPVHFQYHDLSQFPLVFARHAQAPKGCAEQWICEMEMLTASEVPYVLVVMQLDAEIDHEDRKQMVRWQTDNMPRLRQKCRGFVAVQPDPQALIRVSKQAEKMSRAFEVPFVVAPDEPGAREAALRLLRGVALGTTR